MKRKPNKPKQEPRERPGSWESAADPDGAGAADSGTSGQSVHKSKFRQKSKQEQAQIDQMVQMIRTIQAGKQPPRSGRQ